MNIPANLKYASSHEWVKAEGDIAFIGITDYAQNQLGDIIFVDADVEGETFEKREVFGSIEAVKTVAELMMPIGAEVLEVNPKLQDSPDLLNKDPYGEGWLIKVQMTNPDDLDDLMDAVAYQGILD
ncbi:MAG: glycine cleavage system protein GcvH [Bacteroidales bacterium]|jgi:glycine cleavage system H protein|nr:glycine cleavage system protein GcvH [Bacteroidales bacterium]